MSGSTRGALLDDVAPNSPMLEAAALRPTTGTDGSMIMGASDERQSLQWQAGSGS